jgi:hypothetical protein
MDHIPPGQYFVDANFPGCLSPLWSIEDSDFFSEEPQVQARLQGITARVEVIGETPSQINVTLPKASVIRGAVHYEDGSPAPNMSVMAIANEEDPACCRRGRKERGIIAKTDDEGSFRIYGLGAGSYSIVAIANFPLDLLHPLKRQDVTSYTSISVYAPSTLRKSEAKHYSVAAGEVFSNVDIVFTARGLHKVNGRVVGDIGALRGMPISLNESAKENDHYALIDEEGYFEFKNVLDGDYVLHGFNMSDTHVVVKGHDISGLELSAGGTNK